jgi:hypothetical protein
MGRAVLVCICGLLAAAPQAARAQSYQHHSDGLVSVTAKKVMDPQGLAFDVCAQLMRREEVGALHIRLNLWKAAGGFLRQLSSVLQPEIGTPVCQRIQVPQETGHFGRWEVAGFHFLREYAPHRAGRLDSAS